MATMEHDKSNNYNKLDNSRVGRKQRTPLGRQAEGKPSVRHSGPGFLNKDKGIGEPLVGFKGAL